MDDVFQKVKEIEQQNKVVQSQTKSNDHFNPNLKEQADVMAARRKMMEKRFGKGVKEGKHIVQDFDKEAFEKKQKLIEKEVDKTYKHFFIFNLPAPIPDYIDVKIQSPSIKKILEFGQDEIFKFTNPFTVTIDSLFYNSDNYLEIANKYSVFTLLYGNDKSMIQIANQICGGDPFEKTKEILELFCIGCEIRILGSASQLTDSGKKKLIIIPDGKDIKDAYIFDQKLYNAMRLVIQDSMRVSDAKRPRLDRGKSEYIKQNNALMNQKEQYDRKKNAPELAGMINVVSHGGPSYIPYGEILEWNWFQFISSYEVISERIGYESMIVYKTSANFQVKDEVKHWLPAASLQKKEEDKKPVM